MTKCLTRGCISPSSDEYPLLSGQPAAVDAAAGAGTSLAIALTVCRLAFTERGTLRIDPEPAADEGEAASLELWPPLVVGSHAEAGEGEPSTTITTFRHFAPSLAVQLALHSRPPKSTRHERMGIIYTVEPGGSKVMQAIATSSFLFDAESPDCEAIAHGHERYTITLDVGEPA